jgi:cytochrome c553
VRRVLAAALALATLAVPARADLLDYVLGAHRAPPPPAFPSGRPAPVWEGYLSQGTPEAGKLLFTTGQSTEANRKVVVCQSCHGVGAVPDAQAPMPRLAPVMMTTLS